MRLDAWPATPSFYSGSEFRAILRLSSLAKVDGDGVVVDWVCCQVHGHLESPRQIQAVERTLTGTETTFPAFEDRIRDVEGITSLFTSRSSIVACNVELADGEDRDGNPKKRWACFGISARLPPFLPPSYVGRECRVAYGLTIGLQVHGETSVQCLSLPVRVVGPPIWSTPLLSYSLSSPQDLPASESIVVEELGQLALAACPPTGTLPPCDWSTNDIWEAWRTSGAGPWRRGRHVPELAQNLSKKLTSPNCADWLATSIIADEEDWELSVEESLENRSFRIRVQENAVCFINIKRAWDPRRGALLVRSGESLSLSVNFTECDICPIGLHVSLIRIESSTKPDGTKGTLKQTVWQKHQVTFGCSEAHLGLYAPLEEPVSFRIDGHEVRHEVHIDIHLSKTAEAAQALSVPSARVESSEVHKFSTALPACVIVGTQISADALTDAADGSLRGLYGLSSNPWAGRSLVHP